MIENERIETKIKMELYFVGGTAFLNFWDSAGGNDVTGEILEDGLIKVDNKKISLSEFTKLIKNNVVNASNDYLDKRLNPRFFNK